MNTMFDLSGKWALVTGGRGLAIGMAEGLAKAGANVILMSRSTPEAEAFPFVQADLSSRDSLKKGFDEVLSITGGRLDILVNCAGIQRRHEIEEFPIEDWDEVIEVNLTACFELCQLAGNVMLKQGKGKIINIASMISFFGGMRIPAYAASKGGIAQLTKSLAVGWAGKGIQVNAIAPGYMATDMNTALIEDPVRNASILSRIPAGRWGTKEDMAGPCVFLASEASDYVSGAILPVDGAYLVC
ncbi:MAG: SDR family oxidoreductase [Firmicutes bacterium]|nr:SDR family oxidoreductase [Bacillota bacterium]